MGVGGTRRKKKVKKIRKRGWTTVHIETTDNG